MSVLNAQGRPASPTVAACPQCGALCPPGDAQARVASGGFGALHDVCARCGFDFEEYTLVKERT